MSRLLPPEQELEWQRTSAALGKPVDLDALFQIAEEALQRLEEGEATQRANYEKEVARSEARRTVDRANRMYAALSELIRAVEESAAALRRPVVSKGHRLREANTLVNYAQRARDWAEEHPENRTWEPAASSS